MQQEYMSKKVSVISKYQDIHQQEQTDFDSGDLFGKKEAGEEQEL
jgi:hypothetical protein